MSLRLLGLLLAQVLAIGSVWWASPRLWPRIGTDHALAIALAVALAVVWIAWLASSRRAAKVLRWLQSQAPAAEAPEVGGAWGEASNRMRRRLRLLEQEAADHRGRLQEILSALQVSPNGVVLLDAQHRIEWCNQTAAHHFGIDADRDREQAIGHLVRDPSFTAYLGGRDYSHDVVMAGRHGSPSRPVRLSVQLHPYGLGRMLLLSRDVTAVEQAEAMRRDFVANVSHEIRTPLTVVSGFVETLQTLPLAAEERRHYLDLMARQAQRMQTVVSDLLTLSRLEGSPAPDCTGWTPVRTLLTQCEQEARGLSQALGEVDGEMAHQLRFPSAEQAAQAGELAGNPSELLSALSNLVGNALRYTPAGGTVTVECERIAEGQLRLAVRDDGPGIAAEHLPRLTERFYRVDRSRSRETGGTGLGLAIVKHVAQRHGAQLQIESALGKGSCFALVFPAGRVRPAAER
ncbi:MAG: phosphate regulon sensor histidine kinase PhoR [Xylophilus ampelinus]